MILKDRFTGITTRVLDEPSGDEDGSNSTRADSMGRHHATHRQHTRERP
jgi:hypothetical protein